MSRSGWLSGSRSSGRVCGRSPTGCSARSARPTTPSRTPGCGSAAPTPSEVENLGGWLTTIVARVSLNMLRSRKTRREQPLDVHVPDPIVDRRRRHRPRARGAARRLGRPGAARRARDADPARAARVRPARHVRRAVRRDRADRRALSRGGAPAREPRAAAGCAGPRPVPDADLSRAVGGRRRVPRRGARRRLRGARRGARPRRRAAGRRWPEPALASGPGRRDRRRPGADVVRTWT